MKLTELIALLPTDENIDRLLFEGLDLKECSADLIMVLGSRKACEYRVPEAVRLYKQGYAGRLLLCGGKVQATGRGVMPEWQAMKAAAVEYGVREQDILTEERSMSTEENLRYGGEIMGRLDGCRKVILVTTAYHVRRALLMAQKLLPQYTFLPCPVNKGSAFRDNWKKTVKGRETVLDEWRKFGYYIRAGLIDDVDI